MEVENEQDGEAVESAIHTPGPWSVEYDGDYDEWRDVSWHFPHRILGADGQPVVTFEDHGPYMDGDAKLIAAAPTMLKALFRIRADLCRRHSPFVVDQDFAFINDAIREARGLGK